MALHYAAAGWRVAVTDRDTDAVARAFDAVLAGGAHADSFAQVCDVTSEDSFSALAAALEQRWGGLDLMVNNAGVATAGTVADAPLEQWRWVLDINLLGCVRGARAVIPLMTRQRSGHIVNIASFAGIANPPAMASYNAAKAAVISLSETLRFELAPLGIGVSVVCPSFFKTNLIATSTAAQPGLTARAAPQMARIIERLMDKASLTAEQVATAIDEAVSKGDFLVVPLAEDRRRVLIKRLSPELFHRLTRKATEKFLRR